MKYSPGPLSPFTATTESPIRLGVSVPALVCRRLPRPVGAANPLPFYSTLPIPPSIFKAFLSINLQIPFSATLLFSHLYELPPRFSKNRCKDTRVSNLGASQKSGQSIQLLTVPRIFARKAKGFGKQHPEYGQRESCDGGARHDQHSVGKRFLVRHDRLIHQLHHRTLPCL